MVQGCHLQLRSCPPLFRNFWQLNLKAAAAHHPIIQKEVDELHCKGRIEPSSCGAGFNSSVFVVSTCTGCLWPIHNLKWFNHYLHIQLWHVWQLIQHGDYALSIGLQDAYLHIPIVKHCCFLQFVWHNTPYQWKVLPFGLATPIRVLTALTKPILFLFHHKGFCIVIYLDDILVLVCSKWAGKRGLLILCYLLVCLELHINFSMSDLQLTQTSCSWGYVGILCICQYLCLLIS